MNFRKFPRCVLEPNNFFSNYYGQKPDLYKRYINDCVSVTSSSREEDNLFINSVNSFDSALKYTWENSEAWVRSIRTPYFIYVFLLTSSNQFTYQRYAIIAKLLFFPALFLLRIWSGFWTILLFLGWFSTLNTGSGEMLH